MVTAAIPYGLRLHGTGWGTVDAVKHVWQGSLPRYDLADAYARWVLHCTVLYCRVWLVGRTKPL